MELMICAHSTFVYTGGRPFDPALPVVVLTHGAGNDHSVWNFQARHLAHHGLAVLAPDLPGHGRSGGAPLEAIESMSDWLASLLDAVGVTGATLAGHSMGSLIALECAARMPERVERLILLGSVAPMPVAAPLLEAAREDRAAAHAMINQWSYTPAGQLGRSATPGLSLTGLNRRLMERQAAGVLATDLSACNAYHHGLEAARTVTCPTLLLCGERDQMTPARAVGALHAALVHVRGGARMVTVPGAGHAMMAENPDAVSDCLRDFSLHP